MTQADYLLSAREKAAGDARVSLINLPSDLEQEVLRRILEELQDVKLVEDDPHLARVVALERVAVEELRKEGRL